MKKYTFSLQSVLEYDTYLQNRETDILSRMKSEQAWIQMLCRKAKRDYRAAVRNYEKSCEAGISIHKAAGMRALIETRQRQILLYEAELEEGRRKIELQVERLLSVTKDKMTVEKLRENSYAEYLDAMRKKEEYMIEDFIASTAARTVTE